MPWLIILLALESAANNPRNPDLQTMRCKGSVVSVGDPSFELIEKCGAPVHKETVEYVNDTTRLGAFEDSIGLELETRRVRSVQRWYYRFGRGRFARMVEISGGQILRIELLNRG